MKKRVVPINAKVQTRAVYGLPLDIVEEVQGCLVDLGETAESVVSDTLSREKFDCIMVGAGIRALPHHTLLFEKNNQYHPSEGTIIFKNMFQYQSRRHRGSGPPLDVTNMAEL
jgi:hypothetical protein